MEPAPQAANPTPITPLVNTGDATRVIQDRAIGGGVAASDDGLQGVAETRKLSPIERFAHAVVRVMASNSYPLAGHIRDELHASAKALGESSEAGEMTAGLQVRPDVDLEDLTVQLQAKRDELVASAKADLGDHLEGLKAKLNDDLNVAVDQVKGLIKAAGDEQVAAVKATNAS